ncbi:MAG TPA: disulfide bond formation protein B [Hyphomonas sp.]|nr:disulfide bond formation protein B [Hyphomonas sp.]MCA8904113.1 disulfide bond formation protein B [Hyphomonas sp.]HPE47309.1 disulfide bond formation protein B [Hyphomonas sp.]
MSILRSLLKDWQWPVTAILVSALMLAAAHGFEIFAKLYPCPLCLRQREVYWALIAMAVTGLILWKLKPSRRFLVALNVLIGLVFGVGTVVAFFHAGVEWGIFPPPTGCAGEANIDLMNIGPLDKPMTVPSCTDAPFYVLGLSMAGWNGVVSTLLAALSFVAAGATYRGRLAV